MKIVHSYLLTFAILFHQFSVAMQETEELMKKFDKKNVGTNRDVFIIEKNDVNLNEESYSTDKTKNDCVTEMKLLNDEIFTIQVKQYRYL